MNLISSSNYREVLLENSCTFHNTVARVWVLSNEVENATLSQFFLINLYLFDSIFSGIVRVDQLHNYVEGICRLNNGCYGNRRKTFQLSMQQLQREQNISSKTCILYIRTNHHKIELAG